MEKMPERKIFYFLSQTLPLGGIFYSGNNLLMRALMAVPPIGKSWEKPYLPWKEIFPHLHSPLLGERNFPSGNGYDIYPLGQKDCLTIMASLAYTGYYFIQSNA